jgi:hypothetical protein
MSKTCILCPSRFRAGHLDGDGGGRQSFGAMRMLLGAMCISDDSTSLLSRSFPTITSPVSVFDVEDGMEPVKVLFSNKNTPLVPSPRRPWDVGRVKNDIFLKTFF